MPLSFTPLTELVTLLRGQELRADMDPARLNLPGAWVTVETITDLSMDGTMQLAAAVYLISPDKDYVRAYEQLAELYNQLEPALTPDGPVTPQGVVMPGDPTPLPALRVPVNLYT